MKAITIRGIEEYTSEKLKQAAKDEGKSVNQFILDMVQERLGLRKRKYTAVFNDLDHLFGKWSDEEFTRIQGKIDKERKIDKDLWV